MSRDRYSQKCSNRTTYWDSARKKCVSCGTKPGHEVSPNCGRDDDGGHHEHGHRPCPNGTFNDGSSAQCSRCSPCALPHFIQCSPTADTLCRDVAESSTTTPTPQTFTTSNNQSVPPAVVSTVAWAAPVAILVSIVLFAICVFIIRTKKAHHLPASCYKNSLKNQGFSPMSTSVTSDDLESILDANILSAPLRTVLDNLDVLEELVILLDPDTHGVKSTKHLASHWSFPSTWITYTYSMRDTKSPLKAVLEGVACRNPDWTVAQLAKQLRLMERNDAVAVLAKLGHTQPCSFQTV